MRQANIKETSHKMAVDISQLQSMLCCGRKTALKIGTDANAVFRIGKRLLFNVEKIQAYLNKISEGAVS